MVNRGGWELITSRKPDWFTAVKCAQNVDHAELNIQPSHSSQL